MRGKLGEFPGYEQMVEDGRPARTNPKQNRSGIGKFAPHKTPIAALLLAFLSGTILAVYFGK
ncbi:hypothetical protein [Acidocella aromatica]|uniref:Uncharacterized protein n=1 Tax=Acidocella aromatica TaxID=1303579 RepID=A0A840VLK4_9PROT|nr:hypothetical protein [Acidocella aromatica]MBB5373079.1 hypothetical protein [Acidocella aromatica]